jgi:VanZ family protein
MNRVKIFFKVLFFMALLGVTVLALLPVELLTSPVFKWWDKAQHAFAFCVLSVLGFAAFSERKGLVALGLVLYGVSIELAQLSVGWRFGEWEDVLADSTGVTMAWVLKSLWRK